MRAACDREVLCEPVLTVQQRHSDQVAAKLAKPQDYAGLVCTSANAVDALADALPAGHAPEVGRSLILLLIH